MDPSTSGKTTTDSTITRTLSPAELEYIIEGDGIGTVGAADALQDSQRIAIQPLFNHAEPFHFIGVSVRAVVHEP